MRYNDFSRQFYTFMMVHLDDTTGNSQSKKDYLRILREDNNINFTYLINEIDLIVYDITENTDENADNVDPESKSYTNYDKEYLLDLHAFKTVLLRAKHDRDNNISLDIDIN